MDLFSLKDKLIKDALKHAENLAEPEKNLYINTYIEATMSFFTHAMLASLDDEIDKDKKKSA